MKNLMKWFASEESGQGMVEYALIIALVAIVVIGALTALGDGLKGKFNQIITQGLGGQAAT